MARSKKTVTLSKQLTERKRGQTPFVQQRPLGPFPQKGSVPFFLSEHSLVCHSFFGTVHKSKSLSKSITPVRGLKPTATIGCRYATAAETMEAVVH